MPDGSLTDEDVAKLSDALPGVQIVNRRYANEVMRERLKRHPHCFAYRDQQAFALKLLDVPLLSEHVCRAEIVERLLDVLGPDILCWRTEFIPKPPGAEGTI